MIAIIVLIIICICLMRTKTYKGERMKHKLEKEIKKKMEDEKIY